MKHNIQTDLYKPISNITRQQKIKLLEALKNKSISLQSIKPFAGMEFYRVDNHFICLEDLQRYSYEEIENIYNDLPKISDAPGMIEFKSMEKGNLIINKIVILPISLNEMLEHTFKNLL